MVFMENGRMDSNSEIVESHIIMDLGNKSVRTRLNDENEASITFQNSDNGSREKMFSNCNGNSNSEDLSNLTNGVSMCKSCDENLYSSNPKGSNSSQCSINSVQKTISNSLENNFSKLSIKTDHEERETPSKFIESSCKSCDNSSRNNECPTESNQESQSVNQNELKTDICASNPSLVPDDVQSNRSSEKEKDQNSSEVVYICYESEKQMPDIMKLIQKDLSEPYSIYTYRYFIHNWPHLCFLVSRKFDLGSKDCMNIDVFEFSFYISGCM